MEELRNLQQMASLASGRFNQYDGEDFILPEIFKEQVKEINSNTITYNKYSAIIETRGSQHGILNIFMPNQWFYIASYFTDFYNELQKYKKYALKIATKERLKELNGKELSITELNAINSLNIDEKSKNKLIRFITDYSWWGGAKTIDRGDFYVSPILSNANLVNASQSFVAELCAFLANKQDLVQAIINKEESDIQKHFSTTNFPLQQIFYGAPGTGKSNIIKKVVDEQGKKSYRTTFHPDSEYSTFVGCYKPTMKESTITKDGVTTKEEKIIYAFCPQAFTNAYVEAWKTDEEVYLIIEEINRGNCAQIFGDLFQLLDRKDGVSEYPIEADTDLCNHLAKELADSTRTDIPHEVKEGKRLILPANLYIWATMNTSDQSLFPIDSAFKRRWDWQYMPICKGRDKQGNELAWKIMAGKNRYDWWEFIQKVNEQIGSTTNSEDKKLGFFFCKADAEGVISAETFVSKVIFYLWNDVFKDFGFDNTIFNDEEGGTLTFDKFYTMNNGRVVVCEEKIVKFLENLGVEVVPEIIDTEIEEEDEDGNSSSTSRRDYTKYSVNGIGSYGKNKLASECVKEYIKLHPTMSADEVVDNWKSLGYIVPHFIESKEEFDARTDNSKERSVEIPCGSTVLYVVKNGYGSNGKVNVLMEAVNKRDWGITINIID